MKQLALRAPGLMVLAALVVSGRVAAQQTDEATVPVVGEATIRGDSLLAATNAAKMAGYREALHIQLGRLLDSLGAAEAYPRLQSRARSYVRREEVENEEREGNVLRVSLRVVLDVARLKSDLEALGYEVRTIGVDLPSVMVVIAVCVPPSSMLSSVSPGFQPTYSRSRCGLGGSRLDSIFIFR